MHSKQILLKHLDIFKCSKKIFMNSYILRKDLIYSATATWNLNNLSRIKYAVALRAFNENRSKE